MLSVSALTSFLYCQRKLYLQNVLGFYEPIKEPTIKGTIRHGVYEQINNIEESIVTSITKRSTKEELFNKYKTAHSEILINTIRKYKEELKKLELKPNEIFKQTWPLIMEESITRAKNIWEFMQTHLVYGKELWEKLTPKIKSEFRIESEKLSLRGIIDQIEIYTNGYVPVELKTGQCPKEGVWPNHKIQIAAYAMLLEDIYKAEIKEGFIAYLDAKQRRHVPINPFLKQEILELMEKTKSLLESREIPQKADNLNKCKSCGLKERCYDEKMLEKRQKEVFVIPKEQKQNI